MTYNDLHIGSFGSNRYLNFKIFVLGLFSTIIIKVTRKFWFKTGTFKTLVKKFNTLNVDNVKLLEHLETHDISKDEASKIYQQAEKVLKKFITFYNELEKDKFFGNQQLEESVENALLSFYKVEAHLKALATAEINCIEQDSSLIKYASNISLGSLKA